MIIYISLQKVDHWNSVFFLVSLPTSLVFALDIFELDKTETSLVLFCVLVLKIMKWWWIVERWMLLPLLLLLGLLLTAPEFPCKDNSLPLFFSGSEFQWEFWIVGCVEFRILSSGVLVFDVKVDGLICFYCLLFS